MLLLSNPWHALREGHPENWTTVLRQNRHVPNHDSDSCAQKGNHSPSPGERMAGCRLKALSGSVTDR